MSKKQIVHTTSLFKLDDDFQDERFCRVRIRAMHTNINRNGSSFSKECILDAKDTFKNIPVLADVQEFTDEDGNTYLDYTTHSMHVEEDAMNEGQVRVIYDEVVVGYVPETNNFELVYDEVTGNDYVEIDALLLREYGNYVVDILEKKGGVTDVSMEINCPDISYNAKDKVMEVNKMVASAVTLLGDKVNPGMKGAKAEMFSLNEDSRKEQLLKIMQELKESLGNYIQANAEENSEEGGIDVAKEFENEEVSTVEEVTEEVTEEVQETENENFESENESESDESDTTEDDVVEDDSDESDDKDTEDDTDDEDDEDDEVQEEESSQIKCSVKYGENVKEFAVTLSEQLCALSELVNDTYADDLTWYSVDADDKNVIMVDCWSGRAYRQAYKRKGDSFSLKGDRVEVYSIYVTEDEKKALEDMKSNYSSIQDKLQKYEEEPEKIKILESDEYTLVSNKEKFTELMKKENHFDLSIEEVKAKADEITLHYAKQGKLDFAAPNDKVANTRLPIKENKTSRYGTLFSNK